MRYYNAGGVRVAMKQGSMVYYLIGDHLGSTSVVTNTGGVQQGKVLNKVWGEDRYTSGTLATSYRYTGQYSYLADFGLYFYGARWYDPSITQFTQPDVIIPDPYNPLNWNRYSYVGQTL